MNIKTYKKLYNLISFFLLMTVLIGEDNSQLSADWVNASDQSPKKVKAIISDATRDITIKSSTVIDKAKNKIEVENDERIGQFNDIKADVRARLNNAIDDKNSIAMTVNDLKDEVALQRSNLKNYRQKISDANSSIVNSNKRIQEEKDRVQDELTKIPFYEVLVGKFQNLPSGADPIPYEDAIASKISREAINAQLGLSIVNETIIEDGTLSGESISTLLKGKANTKLTRVKKQKEDEDGNVSFDLYRYGLVAVYPFQADDVGLSKGKESNIEVEVEIVMSVGDGITESLGRDDKNKLRNLINEKKLKIAESGSQVKRLARTAKQVIKKEKGKINTNKGFIENYNNKISIEEPTLNYDISELDGYIEEMQAININFHATQNTYNDHVAGEEHIQVIVGEGVEISSKSMEDQFSEIAANTYEEFTTSIKSEYLKEESELKGETLSEIKESKKSDVKLNSIKIVGKFSEEGRGGKIDLIVYVAYNFGFEFEESIDTPISDTIKSTPSNSQLSPFTKQEMPLKPEDNLKVTSKPSGAEIFIEGRKIGVTPFSTFYNPGTYGIIIKKEGYKDGMDVVIIKQTGMTRSIATLSANKAGKGTSLFSKKNLFLTGGGVAILGGAIVLLNQSEKETQQTGSVSISINIP
ncbi:PEGA domain-containing protein [Candidatus Marinimicrobia bacterium]|nr:PEGA domain-containing protein [Candidatus Neomarinimicrobiota bacterium]